MSITNPYDDDDSSIAYAEYTDPVVGSEDMGGDYHETIGKLRGRFGAFIQAQEFIESKDSYARDEKVIEACKRQEANPDFQLVWKVILNHFLYQALENTPTSNDEAARDLHVIKLIPAMKKKFKEYCLRKKPTLNNPNPD